MHQDGEPGLGAARAWIGAAAIIGIGIGLAALADRTPAPRGADAPAEAFAEARALPTVRQLSETIGLRVTGTPGNAAGVEYLVAELRKLPRIEVEVQELAATHLYPGIFYPAFSYRMRNVIARLPGRSREAVLLSAHHDSPPESVGAADDAMAVAAVVETARALAAGPQLEHTVIFLLDDGEELGMLGAQAFTRHPLARDVRAYVYLEAFPAGRTLLLQSGPGNSWLARAYARHAPRPVATAIGEDVLQLQVLPHDGDFRPYHDAGLRGLDLAPVYDAWGLHNHLDRAARLEPGALQHLGDNTLAVVRGLASSALPRSDDTRRTIYYDVLGRVMLVYSTATARVLAVAAFLMLALALPLARRRLGLRLRALPLAVGWHLLALLAGVLTAVAAALLLGLVLRRPHGWYATPLLAVPAFAAPALATSLGLLAWWRRRALRRGREPADWATEAWAGGLLVWAGLLLLCAWKNAGVGYLALWWCAPGAAALAGASLAPRWRTVLELAAPFPALVLTAQAALLFGRFVLPETGLAPFPAPLDAVVALLVALPTAMLALAALGPTLRAGGLGRAAAVLGMVAVVGVVTAALTFPYTAARPKRIQLSHREKDGRGAIFLCSGDPLPLGAAIAGLDGVAPLDPSWRKGRTLEPPCSHQVPASLPAIAPPTAEVLDSRYDAASGVRTVRVRLTGAGRNLELGVPKAALVGWSLSERLPERTFTPEEFLAWFVPPPAAGAEITLRLRGEQPVEVRLKAMAAPATSAELDAVRRKLPAWTAPRAVAVREARVRL